MATVVITGANRGLGLAFAQAFAARDDAVVGTARDPAAAIELSDVAEVHALDVTDDVSVAGFAAALGDRPVDLLLNNAGRLSRARGEEPIASIEAQFRINALGPLRVTRALLPNLKAAPSARIVHITSRMGSIGDNRSGGSTGYRMSKAALNMLCRCHARDLAPIPVMSLHPGTVRTEMTAGRGDLDPDEAVRRMLEVIDLLDGSRTGTFYHRDGYELPW